MTQKSIYILTVSLLIGGAWTSASAQFQQPQPGPALLWWMDNTRQGWEVQTESGLKLNDGDDQKIQLLALSRLEVNISDVWQVYLSGRGRLEMLDNLEPGEPLQQEIDRLSRRLLVGEHIDLDLRQFYISASGERAGLKIGKQETVWGTSDGLKVMDIVNPRDLQEFILDEYRDSRIPLWTVNATVPIWGADVQLLWIPDRTYHKTPEQGGLYDFASPLLRPQLPAGLLEVRELVRRPGHSLKETEAGGRISGTWESGFISFNYLYHYDDMPVLRRSFGPLGNTPAMFITPGYARVHTGGTTFRQRMGPVTLRWEAAFWKDRFFLTQDPADADGVVKSDEVRYVVGLDIAGLPKAFLSVQFFQNRTLDNPIGMVRKQQESTVTALFRRTAMEGRVSFEGFLMQNLHQKDGLFRPKISYNAPSGVRVWSGFDVFYGDNSGFFGQFENRDRVVVGVAWQLGSIFNMD